MITIKNVSAEDLEIVTHVDTEVPGCRVLAPPSDPDPLGPNDEVCLLGYEPGVSYTIRPVQDPEIPRTTGMAPGAFPRTRGA